jgi:hypothetical protein
MANALKAGTKEDTTAIHAQLNRSLLKIKHY